MHDLFSEIGPLKAALVHHDEKNRSLGTACARPSPSLPPFPTLLLALPFLPFLFLLLPLLSLLFLFLLLLLPSSSPPPPSPPPPPPPRPRRLELTGGPCREPRTARRGPPCGGPLLALTPDVRPHAHAATARGECNGHACDGRHRDVRIFDRYVVFKKPQDAAKAVEAYHLVRAPRCAPMAARRRSRAARRPVCHAVTVTASQSRRDCDGRHRHAMTVTAVTVTP